MKDLIDFSQMTKGMSPEAADLWMGSAVRAAGLGEVKAWTPSECLAPYTARDPGRVVQDGARAASASGDYQAAAGVEVGRRISWATSTNRSEG